MAGAMVQAEAVHKRYGPLEVLKGITLEVAPREVMCLLGPSGSGKSTFLRCINHLEKINSGRLYVDGDLVGYQEHGSQLHEPDREVSPADRDRHGLPALQPFPSHDGFRERRRRSRAREERA